VIKDNLCSLEMIFEKGVSFGRESVTNVAKLADQTEGQVLGKPVKSTIPTPHEKCGCAALGNLLCLTNCQVDYQSLASFLIIIGLARPYRSHH